MDHTFDVIIALLFLLILIVFLGWMGYLLVSTNFEKTPLASSRFTLPCLPGQCATDLLSGFKTCPASVTEVISVDPAVAVCNSEYSCDNPLTPFALNFDGSTNSDGVCAEGIPCPCLRRQQCPEYVTSIFTADNGDPFRSIIGQPIAFPQQVSTAKSQGVPFVIDNVSSQFCLAPISWLAVSTPGCGMFSDVVDYEQLLFCMGGARGCSGIQNNPCLQGTLAIVTNDVNTLTRENIPTSTVGCVRGTPCPCGQLAIFDKNFGNVICRDLSQGP